MSRIILVGDPTDRGGAVSASGAPRYTVHGRAVALLGDPCSCHPNCTIIEGDPAHRYHGVPVAYEGHRVSCGARLIATEDRFTKA